MKDKLSQTAKNQALKTSILFPENNYKLLQEEMILKHLEVQKQV